MAKNKVNPNEEVLGKYFSPSRELLRKEEYNFQVGRTIMSEEEFDKIWNDG